MYGLAEYEAQRQRPEEIRREMAAIRLEKAAREARLDTLIDGLWPLSQVAEVQVPKAPAMTSSSSCAEMPFLVEPSRCTAKVTQELAQ